ncbi:MAG: 50S ribosomal protein L23 [Gammaproteobacteria bacterium]|nr:50S ribosomal protein L23 [Gammaproteobacteria bacterium]
MSTAGLYNVLLAPHVSEKGATSSQGYRQYVFKVASTANKPLIKTAVEKLFNVSVKQVRIINVKGKRTSFKRTRGKRSDWKKAYVSLAAGQEIDLAGQA